MELVQGKYTIIKLMDHIIWIYDGINDSIYVDEGEKEAFVIDTGMAEESLLSIIRKEVTDKPLKVVLTHGHLDHSMKVDEFDSFYMWEKDDHLIPEKAHVDLQKRIPLHPSDHVAISDMELIAVDAHGHTPGSLAFINEKHKVVYTGDAFSSGANIWMQLPGCSSLAEYKQVVENAIETFKAYGVDDTWTFLGGHYQQRWQYRPVPMEENAPGMAMMEDIRTLLDKLLSGEIKGEPEKSPFSRGEQAYCAHYGKAEILYCLSQL